MSRDRTRGEELREFIRPMVKEVGRRLMPPGKTMKAVAEAIPDVPYATVRRVIKGDTDAPNWVDMTALIVKSGMTPNEAARLVGFHVPLQAGEAVSLTPVDREVLNLLHDSILSDDARTDLLFGLKQNLERVRLNLERENLERDIDVLRKQREELAAHVG